MATWAEFENAQSELAAFAQERVKRRIVYQATLRLDGGPRVTASPVPDSKVTPTSPPGGWRHG